MVKYTNILLVDGSWYSMFIYSVVNISCARYSSAVFLLNFNVIFSPSFSDIAFHSLGIYICTLDLVYTNLKDFT